MGRIREGISARVSASRALSAASSDKKERSVMKLRASVFQVARRQTAIPRIPAAAARKSRICNDKRARLTDRA